VPNYSNVTVDSADVLQTNNIVKFRLRDGYLILVETRVNDAGLFDFLLDTRTTRTVIDPDLARQLHAPVMGEVSLTGVLHVRQSKRSLQPCFRGGTR
jgi:hypothetical protein